jgi:CubicO group peptidase (beta-lactamase class C family)
MKKIALFVLLLICFQSGHSVGASQKEAIQRIFDYLVANNLFNGTALVVDRGIVVYGGAFGYANVEWEIPNTIDTKFEIGSVTKQFTAALILQLAAEHKIALTDTVSRYLPAMPKKFGDRITIHQLLTHTSGLPTHFSSMADYLKVGLRIPYTFEERLEQIESGEFEFIPGTSWSYNGFGYTVLGEIIARVTNTPLEDNYKERIFDPLGMTQSGAFLDSRLVSKRAYGYQKRWDDSFIPAAYSSKTKAKLGGGGLYSNVEDLLKWHNALQGGAFLSEEMRKQYFTPHYRFPDGSGYCYGNYYERYEVDPSSHVDVYFHGGSLPGTSSLILRVPERNQCVILLHNGGMGHEEFLQAIATEILNVLYVKQVQLPQMSILYSVGYTALFGSIEEATRHYFFLKEHLQDAYVFGPDQLNTMGMVLMQFGAYENVPGILGLSIEEYPEDHSGYRQLGQYYFAVEKKYDIATKYMRKALDLSDGETKDEIRNEIVEIEKTKQGN